MQTHSWADTCSAKVNQGICLCSKESLPTPDDFIRCWVHECQRVFQAPAAEGRLECMMVQTTTDSGRSNQDPGPGIMLQLSSLGGTVDATTETGSRCSWCSQQLAVSLDVEVSRGLLHCNPLRGPARQ